MEGRTYLTTSRACHDDDAARKIAGRLVAMTRQISTQVKKAWDLKALLIREEEFLWDNLTCP
jgi:hypothetical protein